MSSLERKANIEKAIEKVIDIFIENKKYELIFTEKDIQKYFELELLNIIDREEFKFVHQEFPTPIIKPKGDGKKKRGHFDFVYLSDSHFNHCTENYHPSLQSHCDDIEQYYRDQSMQPIDIIVEFKYGRFQSSALRSKAAGIIASDIVKINNNEFVGGLAWDVVKLVRARTQSSIGFYAYWLVFEECGNSFDQHQNEKRIEFLEYEIKKINQGEITFNNDTTEKKLIQNILAIFKEFFQSYQPNKQFTKQIIDLKWLTIIYITRNSKY